MSQDPEVELAVDDIVNEAIVSERDVSPVAISLGNLDIPKKIKIKLSDGKAREIQSTTSTMFFLDGRPASAEEFIKYLFDTLKLPEILRNEDNLRELWSNPVTRSELLIKLQRHGCSKDDLNKLREVINERNSDLYDVLQFIAFSSPAISRKERVDLAQDNIYKFIKYGSFFLYGFFKGFIFDLNRFRFFR